MRNKIFYIFLVFSLFGFKNLKADEEENKSFNKDYENIQATIKLGQWVAEDQALRNGLELLQRKEYSSQRLNPYYKKILDVDKRNTKNLKSFLDKQGWPVISKYGSYGDFNAWILCQHADHDRKFQKRCLRLMEKAFETKDTDVSNFAYLTDRVLVAENKKQKFGSQGECKDKNDWQPFGIENSDQIDELRKKYNLEPFQEYKKRMNSHCF